MSIKKRKKLDFKKKSKRKERRERLKRSGKDPEKYFSSGFYVGKIEKG